MQFGLIASILTAGFLLAILFTTGGSFMSDLNLQYGSSITSSLNANEQLNATNACIATVSETVNQTRENQNGIASGLTPYIGAINTIRALPCIASAGLSTFSIMGTEVSRVLDIGWIVLILVGLFVSIIVLYIAMMILNRGQIP
jgi:hypothetical protein